MIFIKHIALTFTGLAFVGLALVYFSRFHGRVVAFFRTRPPLVIRNYLLRKRARRIGEQMVTCVDMLQNCLKAGLGLQQAFFMISRDGPSPLKEEFALIMSQVAMGKGLEDALQDWKGRISIDDVAILVESILVLKQTGGNLVETFGSISATIRERQRVAGKIKVQTSQGVAQAVVILCLPFALGAGLGIVAPWYIGALFADGLGGLLVSLILILQLCGAVWLKKIVSIKV